MPWISPRNKKSPFQKFSPFKRLCNEQRDLLRRTKIRKHTEEYLAKLEDFLMYDPASFTGLRWKLSPKSGIEAGDEALTCTAATGYYVGKFLGVHLKAHRVVWFLCTKSWPSLEIDHINGDRSNNCIENLREVNPSLNSKNRTKRSDNKSGVTGVSWSTSRGKWKSKIGNITLGYFKDFDEAVLVRLKALNESPEYTTRHGE